MDSHQASQEPQKEMPRYQCHKKVWALQIKEVFSEPGDQKPAILHFMDPVYKPISVGYGVVSRYWPKPGDYFVVYEDGYQSVSPQKAFEEGYTAI
jgi:hypothetical protein